MSVATEARTGLHLPAQYAKAFVYVFFFISGMPALIYQLAWQRVLFRIFGLSMDLVTVIVTAFMLGLGAGSLIGSWLSRRNFLPPLLMAAAIELAIGAFGLCSLSLFASIDLLVQNWTLAERTLAIIALVFIPTALMGGTLPLLIGYLVSQSANVGFSTGGLYRVNALGAVVGCALSALLLFPFLGLQELVLTAAALNGLVCLVAATAHLVNHQRSDPLTFAKTGRLPVAMSLSAPLSLMLVLASGFVSLSFEIFFLHLAAFASGSNSITFAMTLGAFLLGIASGADDAAQWCKKGEVKFSSTLCCLLLANGIAGLAVLPLVTISGPLGFGLIAMIALAAFIVARSLGAIYPLVSHLAIAPDSKAGSRAGLLYFANIVGSAAGSLLTGFVLCDMLGIRMQALLLSGLGIALTSVLVVRLGNDKARPAAAILLGVSALLVLFQTPLTRSVVEAMLYKREIGQHPPFAELVENRYGIVAASPDGTVYGGGIYDGQFNTDLVHDTNGVIRAYSLSLFHPAPRNVFMIGLASGSWAQVVANNPEVHHLTIVEINPGYLPLIRQHAEVATLLKNPKVTIIIDDANRWLKRHPRERYDAIVANTTYHFRSNASTLLSVEFNRMVAAHLNRGGIYMVNTTESARVALTGCESFRYGYRFFNNMVLSDDTIRIDGARWRNNLLAIQIDGRPALDLKRAEDVRAIDHDMAIPAYANYVSVDPGGQPLESCISVAKRDASRLPITDDNMGTEWRYPLGLD